MRMTGKLNAVKVLLKLGADTSIGEKDGYTPIHGAGFQGRAEIARVLVEEGKMNPSDRHADGYTPIQRLAFAVHLTSGIFPRVHSFPPWFVAGLVGAPRNVMQKLFKVAPSPLLVCVSASGNIMTVFTSPDGNIQESSGSLQSVTSANLWAVLFYTCARRLPMSPPVFLADLTLILPCVRLNLHTVFLELGVGEDEVRECQTKNRKTLKVRNRETDIEKKLAEREGKATAELAERNGRDCD
jgi:ankyrin repeat protein